MATVLITGAGGAAIPGLIHRLQRKNHRVLAADMNRYAAGLYVADLGFIIPAGSSAEFLPTMRQICESEGVDVIVPLVDEELINSLKLEEEGIIVILPRCEFVEISLDKFRLMKRLGDEGILVPTTRLAVDGINNLEYPVIIKPRRGRGSRGVGIANSEDELISFLKASPYSYPDLILQKYIHGVEFTVSVVAWRDGEVQAVVPKEIIWKEGITRLAVTRRNDDIESLCHMIQERLHADGPFNVQLRIDQNTGIPIPFEINPRFSTTISLTIASGIDELGGIVTQALDGREKYQYAKWKEGVVLVRQTFDEFIEESVFGKRIIDKSAEVE